MNPKQEDQLILFVKEHPELYNQKLTNYLKKKTEKLALLDRFGQTLKPVLDGETLFKKWTALNNQYLRELRKEKSASGTKGKPKKVWPKFNQLDEFLNVKKPSRTLHNLESIVDRDNLKNNESLDNFDELNPKDNLKIGDLLDNKSEDDLDDDENESNDEEEDKNGLKRKVSATSNATKKSKNSNSDFFNNMNNLFENIFKARVVFAESNQNSKINNTLDDEVDIWFASIKNDCKSLIDKDSNEFRKFKIDVQRMLLEKLDD